MDKREKLAIYASIGLVLIFFGAVLFASLGLGIDVPDCVTDVEPFEESNLIKVGENHYQLQSIARMWNFDPIEVEIPAGSRLDIYLTSADVTHGFHVDHKNVNLMAIPGQVTFTSVEFGEDEVGSYGIVCHEYCGANHHSMEGVIKVRPAEDIVAVTAKGQSPIASAELSETESNNQDNNAEAAASEGGVR